MWLFQGSIFSSFFQKPFEINFVHFVILFLAISFSQYPKFIMSSLRIQNCFSFDFRKILFMDTTIRKINDTLRFFIRNFLLRIFLSICVNSLHVKELLHRVSSLDFSLLRNFYTRISLSMHRKCYTFREKAFFLHSLKINLNGRNLLTKSSSTMSQPMVKVFTVKNRVYTTTREHVIKISKLLL